MKTNFDENSNEIKIVMQKRIRGGGVVISIKDRSAYSCADRVSLIIIGHPGRPAGGTGRINANGPDPQTPLAGNRRVSEIGGGRGVRR